MGESAACVEIQTETVVECSSRTELKRERESAIDTAEPELELSPNKKQAKEEPTNEDVKSEVSNPVVSPKEITSSFQDVSSQQNDLVTINEEVQIEGDDVNGDNNDDSSSTSTSGSLSSEDTLSDDGGHSRFYRKEALLSDNSNTSSLSGDVSTSHVVLEIPKHVNSTSGIRKITFKFSKRKEDYVTESSALLANRDCSVSDGMFETGSAEGGHCQSNMEIKMSKKIVPDEYPTNVKKLLLTGILDGASVKYISTVREVN